MTRPYKPGNYEVGFGKTPQHTRFKKGQSGNPKGRPRGSVNLMTSVTAALNEKVIVVENGERRQISKLDAAVIQAVNRAVKGDPRASKLVFELASLLPDADGAKPVTTTDIDHSVMKNLIKRIRSVPDA